MDIENFLDEEPDGSNPAISALWWETKGDWDKAHKMVQDGNQENNWVHAHLHQAERDLSNAAYWYDRAEKPVCKIDIKEEWLMILSALST